MVDFKKPTKKRVTRTDDDIPEPAVPASLFSDDTKAVPKKAAPARNRPLNFRVSDEFFEAFRELAFKKRMKHVELLEAAFEHYNASQK